MRKLNVGVSIAVLALLLVHSVMGGFQTLGIYPGGNTALKVIAWIMAALVCVHICIGIKLTADTLIAIHRAGTAYLKGNELFWARRISGFAVIMFVIVHLLIFSGSGSGTAYRLHYFGSFELAVQILQILAVTLHVATNIRPFFVGMGMGSAKHYLTDMFLILAVLMVFCGAGMIIYYLRWNVLWRY